MIGLLAAVAGILIVMTLMSKNKKQTQRLKPTAEARAIDKKNPPKEVNTEPPKVDWVRLYEEKCDLEQKLVRLAGGDTGMIAQKNIIEKDLENDKKEENIEMYRASYKRKYEQFSTAYKRYAEILKKAEACPEDMRNLFLESRDEDIYQELLKFTP